MKKIVVALLLAAGAASGASAEDQWEPQPWKTVESLKASENVQVLSTDTFQWTDGRDVLVTFVKTDADVYRCVRYKDPGASNPDLGCYRLVK